MLEAVLENRQEMSLTIKVAMEEYYRGEFMGIEAADRHQGCCKHPCG